MSDPLFRCNECDWRGRESEILTAQNPFRSEAYTINGCPKCGEVEDFTNVCDEPGCKRDAGCGWPSPAGYRRTCGEHMP